MVRVVVGKKNYETLDKQQVVEIRLTFNGVDYTNSKTIEQLEQNNFMDFYPTSPTIIGDSTIIARADPNNKIDESDETNNENSNKVTIKEAKDLNIKYVRIVPNLNQCIISCLFEPASQTDFTKTVEQSNKFIKATYPIRDSGITYESEDYVSKVAPGSPIFTSPPGRECAGLVRELVICDVRFLSILAILQHKDKIIGIADESYFVNPNQKGFTDPSPYMNGVIIAEGYYTASAHEIGHTFGLEDEYKVDATRTVTYPGNPAKGFWVDEKTEIKNAIGFMGSATTKGTFLNDRTKQTVWISDKNYSDLFNQLKRGDAKDPNILLINGFISKNDTIEFGDWYYLENREIINNSQGNYSVELLDKNGQIIDKSQFDINFFMFVEPLGKVDIDTKPFIFPVSYPENTLKVQIKHNDKIYSKRLRF